MSAATVRNLKELRAELARLQEAREDSYFSNSSKKHEETNRLTAEIVDLQEAINELERVEQISLVTAPANRALTAFAVFYATPTPAGAVRLALADYRAQAAPMNPPGELWDQLRKAEQLCTLHDELAEAVRAYVRARNDGGVSMADLSGIADQKLRDVYAKL